ncbi:MAG: nucleotidyl transferase AbiEii/AbiGii toxin family protein [Kiritimatiellales bacterium]
MEQKHGCQHEDRECHFKRKGLLLSDEGSEGLSARNREARDRSAVEDRLELDTTPPPLASTEVKTHLLPTPFQVRLYDLPSLFAGKLHAMLFRDWKSRVKGRDFYDFIWYVSRRVPVNLPHLEARVMQSEGQQAGRLTITAVQVLLRERIHGIDIAAAAEDVQPFLRDPRELQLWNEDFFMQLIPDVRTVES